MKAREKLDKEMSRQQLGDSSTETNKLNWWKTVAEGYAITENLVVVLSNMQNGRAFACYGGFARVLGVGEPGTCEEIDSMWEENVLKRVHPDDIEAKYLAELRFFNYVKRLPKAQRTGQMLLMTIRMRDNEGRYIDVVHRDIYVPASKSDGLWLTLCLYGPASEQNKPCTTVVNTTDGSSIIIDSSIDTKLLSQREKEVLRLIDSGMTSKQLAEELSISIYTVNRHRQDILQRLHVKNSVEACRVARELSLI